MIVPLIILPIEDFRMSGNILRTKSLGLTGFRGFFDDP